MQEIWKSIVGYEGLYQISNLGRVKSCDREVFIDTLGKYQHIKAKILKTGGGKYKRVILCKNGTIKGFSVHRLVAQAFIANPDNLPCINHKDENKQNNCADNLEWCTYKYNNEYNNRIGKCKNKISATLTGRKRDYSLTDEQRRNISEAAKNGWKKRRQTITEREEI